MASDRAGVRVRLVQQVAFGPSPAQRLEGMQRLLRSDDLSGAADLVVLPEMWPVGFFNFEGYHDFAERHFAEFDQLVGDVASERACWVFGGSAPARRGSRYVNRSVVAAPDGTRRYFDKLHLFRYQSQEAELLSPGSELVAFDSPLGRTGLLTCFDLRFPESFRALRLGGCEAFVVVAAWPAARVQHWTALLVARAIENQAWVIGVNGCGRDFGTDLGGASMIVAPDGTVATQLTDEPVSASVALSPDLVPGTRARFPFHDSTIPGLVGHAAGFPVVDSVNG